MARPLCGQTISFLRELTPSEYQQASGVAVDATLVDARGQIVPMPTDFDEFSRTASMHYAGRDLAIRQNLDRLQRAMSPGFYGMHGEWWHFISKNWKLYGPLAPASLRP